LLRPAGKAASLPTPPAGKGRAGLSCRSGSLLTRCASPFLTLPRSPGCGIFHTISATRWRLKIALSACLRGEREGPRRVSDGEGEVGDVGEPQLPPPHPDPLHPQGAERAKKALAIQDLRIPLRLQGREGLGGCRRLDPVSKFPVVNHRLTYPSVAPVEPAMAPSRVVRDATAWTSRRQRWSSFPWNRSDKRLYPTRNQPREVLVRPTAGPRFDAWPVQA
jgi:hypothetical protein